jgi:hypothetical protein
MLGSTTTQTCDSASFAASIVTSVVVGSTAIDRSRKPPAQFTTLKSRGASVHRGKQLQTEKGKRLQTERSAFIAA